MIPTLNRPAHVTFSDVITAALQRAEAGLIETHDVVAVSGVGAGRYGKEETADIWQVVTESAPRLYTIDPALAERLRLWIGTLPGHHRPGMPVCHLRVQGVRFTDMAGHDSLLVSTLIEDPDYLGVTGLLSATITALAALKPVDQIDALLIVAHETGRPVTYDSELSREDRTLTFTNQGRSYAFSVEDNVVSLTVTEGIGDDEEVIRVETFTSLWEIEHDLLQNLERE